MDQLARDFSHEAHFLFIYVREAHPDDYPGRIPFPAHKSLEQKLEQARTMRDMRNTPRTILIDSLDGDVHRLYSGLPNMSWIFDHAGRIAHKFSWTVADDIRAALEDTLSVRGMLREGSTRGYYRESLSVTPVMRDTGKQKELDARREAAQGATN